jgi:hypothetical protein
MEERSYGNRFKRSWCILASWGLSMPKKQCERLAGANLFLPPGLMPWTDKTTQRADAPQSLHSGRVERYA